MNTVILETRGMEAAVLAEDGCIYKVANKNYMVGQTVFLNVFKEQINKNKLHKIRRGCKNSSSFKDGQNKTKILPFVIKHKAYVSAAAVAVLFISVFSGAYFVPCSSVTFDINPSIEYKLNLFNRVVDITALNDDAATVVDEIKDSVKGKSIGAATDATLTELNLEGYVESDTSVIYSLDTPDILREYINTDISDSVESWNANTDDSKNITAQIITVTDDLKQRAKELGVSAGKLYLVEELQSEISVSSDTENSESDFDENEWLEKSVTEITKAIESNRDGNTPAPKKDDNAETANESKDSGLNEQGGKSLEEGTIDDSTAKNNTGAANSGTAKSSLTKDTQNAGSGSDKEATVSGPEKDETIEGSETKGSQDTGQNTGQTFENDSGQVLGNQPGQLISGAIGEVIKESSENSSASLGASVPENMHNNEQSLPPQ